MPQLPNGSKLHLLRAGTGTATFTAITAGTSTKITVASATGFKVGDVVMLTNATNPLLNNAVGLVSAVAATSLTIVGVDTSNTTDFPTSEAVGGTVTNMTAITTLPLTSQLANSGGDATSQSVQYVQENKARSYHTGQSAQVITLTMAYDMLDGSASTLKAISKSQEDVIYRVFNPRAQAGKGEYRYFPANAFYNGTPAMDVNNVETVSLVFTMTNDLLVMAKTAVDALVSGS